MNSMKVGSVQKLWFGSDRMSGSFSIEENEEFSYCELVRVTSVNPTDETELELEFCDESRVWAQDISTY